eukprot:gene9688-13041_t
MPDNMVTFIEEMPFRWKWGFFGLYWLAFIVLMITFTAQQYVLGRTSTFITLDNTSGVCKDDPSSTTCCEVPQSVTGSYLADSSGKWNTQTGFSYVNNIYQVTLLGLTFTNAQWKSVMNNIADQVKSIGNRGKSRDFSWNLVALSSFSAQNTDQGLLQFFSSGSANIIFNKQYIGVAYASAKEQCQNVSSSVVYNSATSYVSIDTELCDNPGGCGNISPCPSTISSVAMGYDTSSSLSSMTIRLNMQAITTALAVNMRMTPLNHLVEIPNDNARVALLNQMVKLGQLTNDQANRTSSYYDPNYAPVPPIYCISQNAPVFPTSYTWAPGLTSCFIRIGNILAYPVINSFGYTASGDVSPTEFPIQCLQSAVQAGGAAGFYCNQFDVVVSLIYYPVENLNSTSYKSYTYKPNNYPTKPPTRSPTRSPTQPTTSPSGPSNSPTTKPSNPSRRPISTPTATPTITSTNVPTKPTAKPTANPTGPSANPTKSKPTAAPSIARRLKAVESLTDPTAEPTEEPTAVPSALSTTAGKPTATPSSEPTFSPTNEPTFETFDDDYVLPPPGYYAYQYHYQPIPVNMDPTFQPSSSPSVKAQSGGGSSYYSSLQDYTASYSAATDDFIPATIPLVDNGLIFNFSSVVQLKANQSNGDIWASNQAWEASIASLLGFTAKTSSFTKAFSKLCGSVKGVPNGCAMLVFEVYGGKARDISKYFFQPTTTPAFTNTIYFQVCLQKLAAKPPTVLVQLYYSCVLSPWNSFYAAVGLANSSTDLYVGWGFTFAVFFGFLYLTKGQKLDIPTKIAKMKADQLEEELKAKDLELMRQQFHALRQDLLAGPDANMRNFPALYKAVSDAEDSKSAEGVEGIELKDVMPEAKVEGIAQNPLQQQAKQASKFTRKDEEEDI